MNSRKLLYVVIVVLFLILSFVSISYIYSGEPLPYYYEWFPEKTPDSRIRPNWAEANFRSPLVIAHRGDHFGARENSLDSVRRAYQRGYDGVELDINVTADGIPVIFHSEVVYLDDKPVSPSSISLAELRKMSGSVDTLSSVMDAYGADMFFILELKYQPGDDFSWIDDVCLLLREKKLHDTILLSSLNPVIINHAQKRCPGFSVMYESGMDLPLFYNKLGDIYHSSFLSINWKLQEEGQLDKLIEAGLFNDYKISIYTPDTYSDLKQAVKKKPLLIQTDRPGLLRHILNGDITNE